MGKFSRLGNELYQGRKSIDFVGRRALWYGVTLAVVAVAILVIVVKGLNFGIEFTGGTEYRIDDLPASVATQDTVDELRDEIGNSSVGAEAEPTVSTSGEDAIIVQTENVGPVGDKEIRGIIQDVTGASDDQISKSEIGASWGQEIAKRALLGVAIFLTLVVLFIWAYFREWKMSVAALVALFHDIILTIGVYSFSGFSVTPAAVTGLLAILGFSLKDLALAQFVGMAAGVYSSVFIAPRLLVHMKSNETEVKLAEKRAKAREKKDADRYAAVPVFTEDMPVRHEGDLDEGEPVSQAPTPTQERAPEAANRGRIAPQSRGPVEESRSSGRQQPTR